MPRISLNSVYYLYHYVNVYRIINGLNSHLSAWVEWSVHLYICMEMYRYICNRRCAWAYTATVSIRYYHIIIKKDIDGSMPPISVQTSQYRMAPNQLSMSPKSPTPRRKCKRSMRLSSCGVTRHYLRLFQRSMPGNSAPRAPKCAC